jgi:hypothetical protein
MIAERLGGGKAPAASPAKSAPSADGDGKKPAAKRPSKGAKP